MRPARDTNAVPEMPPRVEYSLSEFGETMRPILEALREWGMTNNERISAIVDGGREADKVSDGRRESPRIPTVSILVGQH